MNGEPPPHDHGFPVRFVVPSWTGIASITWAGGIEVAGRPLYSPRNTDSYRLFGAAYPEGDSAPLSRRTVKSAWEPDRTLLSTRAWRTGRPDARGRGRAVWSGSR